MSMHFRLKMLNGTAVSLGVISYSSSAEAQEVITSGYRYISPWERLLTALALLGTVFTLLFLLLFILWGVLKVVYKLKEKAVRVKHPHIRLLGIVVIILALLAAIGSISGVLLKKLPKEGDSKTIVR